MRSRWILVAIGLVAFALSFTREYQNAHNVDMVAVQPRTPAERPYAGIYVHPTDGWQARLNQSDGQAFAQLATDPALRRPLVFLAGREEAAYRAQRPLFVWLTWLASGGQRSAVPVAVYLVTALSVAALVVASGLWLRQRGLSPLFGLGMLYVPGVQAIVTGGGPDALAAVFVLGTVLVWDRPSGDDTRRDRSRHDLAVATVLLVLAALTRETMLLAALVAALRAGRRQGLVLFAAPFAAYGAWTAVVRVRYGAWPFHKTGGLEFVTGLTGWFGTWRLSDWVICILGFVVGALALLVGRTSLAGWIAAAYALVSVGFGDFVWHKWEDFSRVLVPLWVLGTLLVFAALVAVVERLRARPSPVASAT
ncbi:MAG: hypothetical protein AB7L13_12585 [Acidimicrobiia bacterium]